MIMPPSDKQRENYEYFQRELKNLLSNHDMTDKYLIIYDLGISGVFDTFESAYREACLKDYKDYIIQQVIDERKIVNYVAPAVVL